MLEYVAKFTELVRFANDYVATDMAKVRKSENGLKMFIRAKIVRLLLHDTNLMVKIAIVRPEKFQFLERGQNRNFDYKIVISVKNLEFIL